MERFGLTELAALAREMPIGGRDVKTIRLILGVLQIPNQVVSEAKQLVSRVLSTIATDKDSLHEAEVTKTFLSGCITREKQEAERLEKIINKFS